MPLSHDTQAEPITNIALPLHIITKSQVDEVSISCSD